MSVAQDVSFQTQLQLFDRFPTVVGNVDVDEDGSATDPNLAVETSRHPCRFNGAGFG